MIQRIVGILHCRNTPVSSFYSQHSHLHSSSSKSNLCRDAQYCTNQYSAGTDVYTYSSDTQAHKSIATVPGCHSLQTEFFITTGNLPETPPNGSRLTICPQTPHGIRTTVLLIVNTNCSHVETMLYRCFFRFQGNRSPQQLAGRNCMRFSQF